MGLENHLDQALITTGVVARENINSFNLTMEEEFKKIMQHTYNMRSYQQYESKYSEEEIPCDFLRYVVNVRDDLE